MGAALKRIVLLLIGILMVIPAAFVAMQDSASPIGLQITGVNDTAYPTVIVNANVFDRVGQPVLGLGINDFKVVGELVGNMEVVKVENVTDDSLSFSVVLAIDTSGSMTGSPIEQTIIAAKSFINNIGETDPVAIVTFDNRARLVQDFTTDKALLNQTIDTLRYGGETALYDGSLLAVTTAGNSPVPRRAVIILSDGQEYRASQSARESALDEALSIGVPVYTIGEGFGFDRSFMEGLAQGTSAQFYESPNPDQLNEIYNALAAILRSQYIITLTSDLPGDGQTHDVELEVTNTDGATATAASQFRARIYQPIISFPDLPTEAIAEPTDVTAQVLSDDGITSATYQINDGETVSITEPYTFTIDPSTLSSGENTVTFTATDTTGDTTTIDQTFLVATKPPIVTISAVPTNLVTAIDVTITGTAIEGTVQGLIVKVNDAVVASSQNNASTTITLDPVALPPGENTLTAIVRDSVGGRVEQTITFSVPALAPNVAITGLTAGETITENRTIGVDVSSPQTPLTGILYKVDGVVIATQTEEPFTLDLDVESIGVGSHILTIEAGNEGGAPASVDVAFIIAPPPTATPTATSTSTNTPLPPTATHTNVPPTNTSVPPTATNTNVPATATDTSVPATATSTDAPATNTSVPATVDANATSAVQANVATSDAATSIAAVPTNTDAPPTATTAPATSTNTARPPTSTTAPTNTDTPPTATNTDVPPTETDAPPTSTATTEATAEITAEVTEAATDEATAEATEASTAEVTAEVTESATAEVTADSTTVAAAATNTTAATITAEATEDNATQAPGVPTFTPIPLTAESQDSAGQTQSPLLIGAVCLLGLLLLAVVYWLAARRPKR